MQVASRKFNAKTSSSFSHGPRDKASSARLKARDSDRDRDRDQGEGRAGRAGQGAFLETTRISNFRRLRGPFDLSYLQRRSHYHSYISTTIQ